MNEPERVGEFLRIIRLGAKYQAWCEWCEEDKPYPVSVGPSLIGIRTAAENHEKRHHKKARRMLFRFEDDPNWKPPPKPTRTYDTNPDTPPPF